MNRLIILMLFSCTLASCSKIRNVHFHGHIINGCRGTPVANIQINIYRDYDNGTEQVEQIGAATTNSDGYYELTADVSSGKGFKYYYIFTSGVSITHTENATNDSKDVLMDGTVSSNEPFNFHIKNTNPFDNNDSFNSLAYLNDSNHWWPIIIDSTFNGDPQYHNLKGESVDFIYYDSLANSQPDYYFAYSYTKNGTTAYKYDTVHMSCLDITEVDIFY